MIVGILTDIIHARNCTDN